MEKKGSSIQSVDRAIQILEQFNGPVAERGISDIAAAMGLSKSTVYGLANTLQNAGFLEQNPDNKRYRLGLRLFQLGCLVQNRIDIREIGRPYLKSLADTFEMTVHMGLYQDHHVVYIDKMDAENARIIYSQIGKNAPMHCTGIGKAVFAHLPRQDQEYLMSQPREMLTANTITDEKKLWQELDQIKKRGYATDLEEVEPGLGCVAVPLYNHEGSPVAAISISGSKPMIEAAGIKRIADRLLPAAREISSRMGYRG